VQLDHAATASSVTDLAPDRVVLATGAPWSTPTIPGADLSHVMTVDGLRRQPDHLAGRLGDRVVVVGAGKAAVSLATAARRLGRTVTLVADDLVLAPELGLPGRFRGVQDLQDTGVALHLGATVASITADAVVVHAGPPADPAEAGPIEVGADTVLFAAGRQDPLPAIAGLSPATASTVLGDATGSAGLERGLLAAAGLAARVGAVSR
jgi:pyruvate/2-oxoglutarate dehydrogenase complex dihydrolipoamide dehydrogenase (E3) component